MPIHGSLDTEMDDEAVNFGGFPYIFRQIQQKTLCQDFEWLVLIPAGND